jgi:hypothetical protein
MITLIHVGDDGTAHPALKCADETQVKRWVDSLENILRTGGDLGLKAIIMIRPTSVQVYEPRDCRLQQLSSVQLGK